MNRLLSFLLAAAIQPAVVRSDESEKGVCKFKVTADKRQTVVVGPPEIVDRVVPLVQEDSPVQILRVDFGHTILDVGGGRYYFEDGYTVQVKNRSDRPVLAMKLIVHVRSRDGGAGGGPTFEGELSPGQVTTLRSGRGYAEGGARGDEVQILLGIRVVQFSDCEYSPSQGLSLWR